VRSKHCHFAAVCISALYTRGFCYCILLFPFIQCHCVAVFGSVVCTGALLYCRLCECCMYWAIIVLQSVSLFYEQGHYCTAGIFSLVFTGSLLNSSLCHCVYTGDFGTTFCVNPVYVKSLLNCCMCRRKL